MAVPIGFGMLKVAAWMVPNGDFSMKACARSLTPGWCASSAPRS